MLSFAAATRMFGLSASIATAGSYCLFCENGLGGLPTDTSVSELNAPASPTPMAATAAPAARLTNSFRMLSLSQRSSLGTPPSHGDGGNGTAIFAPSSGCIAVGRRGPATIHLAPAGEWPQQYPPQAYRPVSVAPYVVAQGCGRRVWIYS